MPMPRWVMTISSCWFSTSVKVRTIPRSGLLREGVTSTMVNRARRVSPGRTGFSQRFTHFQGYQQGKVIRLCTYQFERATQDIGPITRRGRSP